MKSVVCIIIAVGLAAAESCPPKGWERCGNTWPPPNDGYCCSKYGSLGNTPAHCNNGGINALDKCCSMKNGTVKCQVECEDPPTVCTGVSNIDEILLKSKIGCHIGLSKNNKVYTW